MKKRLCICIIGLLLTLSAHNLYAAESVNSAKDQEYIQQETSAMIEEYAKSLDDAFLGLKDTDRVLHDELGGWMHGSCVVVDLDGNILGEYDSETDFNSVTVAQAKKIMVQEAIDNLQK